MGEKVIYVHAVEPHVQRERVGGRTMSVNCGVRERKRNKDDGSAPLRESTSSPGINRAHHNPTASIKVAVRGCCAAMDPRVSHQAPTARVGRGSKLVWHITLRSRVTVKSAER
jgi:hypothetical protein